MQQILEQLESLRKLSGNAQIDYLRMIQNDLLKDVLEYTLNTHKKYKIDELKYNKIDTPICVDKKHLTREDWDTFKTYLDHLAEIKSAKDQDIFHVKTFIEDFIENDFLKMVLYKDLRINMGAKKIQKVWPDFCVTYPYMGCKGFSLDNLNAITYPAYAQTKMDGSFCNVIVDLKNNKVEYISRQSKVQPVQGCLDEILLKSLIPGTYPLTDKFVITGELLVWDNFIDKPMPRKLSNGILRRKTKIQAELDRIHIVAWDVLPYENFVQKHWDVPYKQRLELLQTRFQGVADRFHVVDTQIVNSPQEALNLFQEKYEQGEEGIVVKNFTQTWRDGKPAGQVKVKAEKSCELRMKNFIEGKGNYANMCGSIRCVSEDERLEVFVKPRTEDDALSIWYDKDFYYNKILEVKFNDVINSDTKEKPSLYLPVFVEVRDKDKADTYEEILAMMSVETKEN